MLREARRSLAARAASLAALGFTMTACRCERADAGGALAPATSAGVASPASPVVNARFERADLREKFVGSQACAPCHRDAVAAYARSHHAVALVEPKPDTLLAKFAGTSFSTPLGGVTRFVDKNGDYAVTTADGAGRSATFRIAYAAGVDPLQQYVLATERGKLQTLGVSWDSRAAAAGGERWFHVYGPRGVAPRDELYFTRPSQNWNHVCADCHSTFVERRYDLAGDRFDTRWAELTVGCEACHGPGADHVRAARDAEKRGAKVGGALAVALRAGAPWTPLATGSPAPRRQDGVEVEVCAPCHSRREPLAEGFLAGDALLDAFEPELLRPGLYHADGQVEGEVYEWGSFLQSKMYASGVRCSDCHEPHAGTLRAEGNALCSRCHSTARFDDASHSHHTGEKAPLCVDCHMPRATFMQIDERRDHSLRIPRPDLSVEFGSPNACNLCHTKQPATWARDHVAAWYPAAAARPHFARALLLDENGALDAPSALRELASDASAPAIARATALSRLGRFPAAKTLETLRAGLASPDELVVYGAVLGVAPLPLRERVPLLVPAISHGARAVRVAAAKALAALPPGGLEPRLHEALERAFAEVEEGFAVGASRPDTHVERSAFLLARNRPVDAEAALRAALRLSPCLPEAHLNLADLARARADEAGAEREIRAALACDANHATAHHALGLWYVRARDGKTARARFEKAVALAPENARFRFVLAVAQADGGDLPAAVKTLESATRGHPNDLELLRALGGYLAKLGDDERASEVQRRIERLLGE
jgi:predicted CXXCH cytochrome family protein